MDKTVLKVVKLGEERSDFAYWQSQPYIARLAALESIRTEYNTWKYGTEQRFQRVYQVTQFKQG